MQPIKQLQLKLAQLESLQNTVKLFHESLMRQKISLNELGACISLTERGYEVYSPHGTLVYLPEEVIQAYTTYLNRLKQAIEHQHQHTSARLQAINTLLNTEEEPAAITDQFQTQGDSHD